MNFINFFCYRAAASLRAAAVSFGANKSSMLPGTAC